MEGQRLVCHCTIHRSSSFPHDQGEKTETSNEGSSEKILGGFKFSSKNAVFWVHTSQKQSNSKFYYIILLGSLPSFYWYHFYLIWLRFDGDTARTGNPKTRQGKNGCHREQWPMVGNNNIGWGFQKHWQGTTSFPDLRDVGCFRFLIVMISQVHWCNVAFIVVTVPIVDLNPVDILNCKGHVALLEEAVWLYKNDVGWASDPWQCIVPFDVNSGDAVDLDNHSYRNLQPLRCRLLLVDASH